MSLPRPPSPRSPRPSVALAPSDAVPALPPGVTLGLAPPPPPPRPSLSSMLFLTAFFFFMSGGNNMPDQQIIVGPDGEIQQRVTELDIARLHVHEYKGWLNNTGNWTEPATPVVSASSLIAPAYDHEPQAFFTNITGFYREAKLHPVNLLIPQPTNSHFFRHDQLPNLNTSSWNETRAEEMRGSIDWDGVTKWGMNLREREIDGHASEWSWVKGAATLTAEDQSIDYNFYGLHHLPNGTYNLFAQPDGIKVDIRNIPRLYPDHHNVSSRVVLTELEKELKTQEENMLLSDVKPDDHTETTCPLLIYLTLPPLPSGVSFEDMALYESELRHPSGIAMSLKKPPAYWEGLGLGGVVVADQCGWAYGIEGGTGVVIDDFWRKSVNYSAFATVSQLLVLVLLVRQMETTRTPSTLAKVSLWTIVIMSIADSWIFSAHAVIGIMSDNKTSLPMLVPAFLFLCSAVVFGPRYAVLLHRIQAPERVTPPVAVRPATSGTTGASAEMPSPAMHPVATVDPTPQRQSLMERLRNVSHEHPMLKWFGGITFFFLMLQFAVLPPIVPFFLFGMYSFWLPQIWRNARRGTSSALDREFIIGTSLGRLALPLYVFGCPDNVFFFDRMDWIWGIAVWQWAQIMMLFAQERFGPAFFLPKSLAPSDSYNYHPLLPHADPENPTVEETCSICMEPVDTRANASGEVLLGMNLRRAYALAPCHHLFHTKCLAQWMAVKTICPLCKRSLPAL